MSLDSIRVPSAHTLSYYDYDYYYYSVISVLVLLVSSVVLVSYCY